MSSATIFPESLLNAAIQTVQSGDVSVLLASEVSGLSKRMSRRVGDDGQVIVVAPDASTRSSGRSIRRIRGIFADLALDIRQLEMRLTAARPRTLDDLQSLERGTCEQKATAPLIHSASVDSIVAVGVLRSIPVQDRVKALNEMYRVLKKHGRIALIEVVSDEPMSDHLQQSSDVPGAFQEFELLEAFETARFHGLEISHFDDEPCASVEGIDFRRVLIRANKGKEGMCVERYQGVVYLGPWKIVEDDDGHVIKRGQRFAVCDKTFNIYKRPPYAGQFAYIEPAVLIPFDEAKPWDVRHPAERLPSETKGTYMPESSGVRPPPAPANGTGFMGLVEWRTPQGDVTRRAKVTHRFRGYFESVTEALDTARQAFPDASSYRAVEMPFEELMLRHQRAGRAVACPLPSETASQ